MFKCFRHVKKVIDQLQVLMQPWIPGPSNDTSESNWRFLFTVYFNRICIKIGIRNPIKFKRTPRSNASLSVIDVSGCPVMTSEIGEYLKNNQYTFKSGLMLPRIMHQVQSHVIQP